MTKLDLGAFIQAYVHDNLGPAEAYRRAGYTPEGDKDNAGLLAQRYLKKPEVIDAIEEAQRDTKALAKNLTLNALKDFLEKELHMLEPKEKGKFLLAAADKLGLAAARQVEHTDRTVIGATEALAKLKALISANPAARNLIDVTPAGRVVESDAGTGAGDSEADSGNRGE